MTLLLLMKSSSSAGKSDMAFMPGVMEVLMMGISRKPMTTAL